jgi:hypothetical protein
MAIKKSTPTPPRPPRTSGSGPVASRTPSKTPTGRRQTKPVIMVKPKRALKKSAVRNPSAPGAAGPRGGGVRVITKSESFMKKDKARSARLGTLPLTKTVTDSMKTSGKKSYKSDPRTVSGQAILNNPKGSNVQKMVPNKGNKPTKITPKKKTPPKPKPKRKFFGRSGGGMFGGGGAMNDYNR